MVVCTIFSCTCEDFQKGAHEIKKYMPCKHTFILSTQISLVWMWFINATVTEYYWGLCAFFIVSPPTFDRLSRPSSWEDRIYPNRVYRDRDAKIRPVMTLGTGSVLDLHQSLPPLHAQAYSMDIEQ